MYLSSAIKTIKSYCLNQDDCNGCIFASKGLDDVHCSLRDSYPIGWKTNDCDLMQNNRSIDDVISWFMVEFSITKEQATTLYHLLHITINSFKEG